MRATACVAGSTGASPPSCGSTSGAGASAAETVATRRSSVSDPNSRASSCAADAPTCRMPRPKSRRDSGCARDAAIASIRFCALRSAQPVELDQLLDRELVQVGRGIDQPRLEQLLQPRVGQSADVHRVARREVHQPFQSPAGAGDVRDSRPPPPPRRSAPACRRPGSDRAWPTAARSPSRRSGIGRDHLRNHLAGALHLHPVAHAQVLLPDQRLVVQRGQPHRGAADLHRLEHGERVERAGAPDVHLDVEQPRVGDVGRELARDRPARLASAHHAQLVLQRQRVHLHHAAVDGEVERAAHACAPPRSPTPPPRSATDSGGGAAPPARPTRPAARAPPTACAPASGAPSRHRDRVAEEAQRAAAR